LNAIALPVDLITPGEPPGPMQSNADIEGPCEPGPAHSLRVDDDYLILLGNPNRCRNSLRVRDRAEAQST
jgi:hypothetical protein